MKNYTSTDVCNMFKQYEKHITHVIVAHTYHRPYVASCDTGKFKDVDEAKYISAKLKQTSKDLTYALNCFNKLLYPNSTNKAVRHPLIYKPLSFVTIEGAKPTTDVRKTIHVNISLGNLPSVLTTEDIETLFRHTWHDKAKQSSDIFVTEYYKGNENLGWEGYIVKEGKDVASRMWSDNSIWDVSNCWIPHIAINAD